MPDPFAARLRAAASACLPPGAFLRRDRGAALFVTDAPRRGDDGWRARLEAAGFTCRVEGGLAALTPGPRWMDALTEIFPGPPDFLSASLERFRGLPCAPGALDLFAAGLRALDGGEGGEVYERRLRQRAAVCLRGDGGGGGLYACALLAYLLREEREP